MTRQIEAVYENGVLRPLEPLNLDEKERVRLTITNDNPPTLDDLIDLEFMESCALEVAGLENIPSHAEVREMLSHDKSSWSDAVIAGREER
jgi:predicted DNA-binding antitoxin AbrB/MazE fold protein